MLKPCKLLPIIEKLRRVAPAQKARIQSYACRAGFEKRHLGLSPWNRESLSTCTDRGIVGDNVSLEPANA